MAVLATPTKGDPLVLAQISGFSVTANTAIVTPANASTRGVLVTSLVVTNTAAAAATFTMKHKNAAATYFVLCNAISIPCDGVPVDIIGKGGLMESVFLMTGSTVDLLTGNAGTASALDINAYGIQYDT